MAYILLTGVTYNTPPLYPIKATVKYKLCSQPDIPANWITWSEECIIDNTTFAVVGGQSTKIPHKIEGLTHGECYDVELVPQCGSAAIRIQLVAGIPTTTSTTTTTTTEACPVIDNVDYSTGDLLT